MAYSIDKSLSWDGLYKFTSDSGASYMVKMRESSHKSGLWTIEFIRPSGNAPAIEIFRTMRVLSEICKEHMDKVGGNRVIMLISGDKDESLKKANVFTRYMGENWNSTIEIPEIKISGLRSPQIKTTNYIVIATRVSYNKIENIDQTQTNELLNIGSNIKFCFNCGTPNNNFAFCPNCGTKLKQN